MVDHPVCAASVASHIFLLAQPPPLTEEGIIRLFHTLYQLLIPVKSAVIDRAYSRKWLFVAIALASRDETPLRVSTSEVLDLAHMKTA